MWNIIVASANYVSYTSFHAFSDDYASHVSFHATYRNKLLHLIVLSRILPYYPFICAIVVMFHIYMCNIPVCIRSKVLCRLRFPRVFRVYHIFSWRNLWNISVASVSYVFHVCICQSWPCVKEGNSPKSYVSHIFSDTIWLCCTCMHICVYASAYPRVYLHSYICM